MRPDLLQPTLARETAIRPIYSSTALLVPAFFGGPVAAAVVFATNAVRSGRLRSDAPLALAAAASVLLVPVMIGQGWFDLDGMRFASRILGLGAGALLWLRHRALYRAQELSGVASPPGWTIGLIAFAAGLGSFMLLRFAMMAE
jgi:hypothetical protein